MQLFALKYAHERIKAVINESTPDQWRSTNEEINTREIADLVFPVELVTKKNPATDSGGTAIPVGHYCLYTRDGRQLAISPAFLAEAYVALDEIPDSETNMSGQGISRHLDFLYARFHPHAQLTHD